MAGEDIASLGIKVDASQVDAGKNSLAAFTQTGKASEAQIVAVNTATERLVAGMKAAGLSVTEMQAGLAKLGYTTAEVNVALNGVGATAKATATGILSLVESGKVLGAYQSAMNTSLASGATAFVTATQAAARYGTTLNVVNKEVGLTDVALKSASASAAVFGQSLEGLAAIEASAAEGMDAISVAAAEMADAQVVAAAASDAAWTAMVKGLTGLSDAQLGVAATATEEAGIVIAANEAMAASAVKSAAVQVGADDVIKGSSIKVRESLVILREASRGDLTRLAGSATILANAFGLLNAILIPLGIAAAALGAGFALAENQINSGKDAVGDLTVGLGLTEKQLERVKDRYVTFGDTVKATFQVIWRDIGGDGGALSQTVQTVWDGIASFIVGTMEVVAGIVLGSIRDIEEAWKAMPTILGGEGSTAGIDFAKAFQSGVDDAKKSVDGFFTDVANQARDNALKRILKQAGSAPQDHTEDQVNRTLIGIDDQYAAVTKYNDALTNVHASLGDVLADEQADQQLKGIISKVENDHAISLQKQIQIVNTLTDAQKALNLQLQEEAAWKDEKNMQDHLNQLELEYQLIGATAEEQARQLAILQETQRLRAKGGDALVNSDAGQSAIASAANNAVGSVELKKGQDAYNMSLKATSNYLKEAAEHAQAMSSTFQDAFGAMGKAVDGLTKAFTDYTVQQSIFAEQQEKIDKLDSNDPTRAQQQIELTQKKRDVDVEYYADVLDSAKNFFGHNTAAFKVLQDVETAYRAFQLVSSIRAIIASATETSAKVAGVTTVAAAQVAGTGVETSTTAVSVANAGTQSTAWGITAVVKAIASLPFPFDLVAGAVVLAAVVGIGAAIGGSLGGKGGGTPAVDPAKATQAAQGAGSVLGDATAKSDSIAKSIDQLTKDTNTDLEYSNQMVISLKAIQNGISSLTSLLAQQLQVGGLFDTSKLGLGTSGGGGGILSTLLGGIFGSSKTTTTLLDQGISIAATTVGQAVAGSISASAFQTVQNVKKSSSLFGLISSTKTTDNTSNSPLDSDFTSQITGIVGGLRSTVLDAANKLGVQGAQQVVDSLALNIGSISLKDMTGDQIQSALNAVFSKLGDQLATAIIPQLSKFQQVGEGSLQTLSRLVAEYRAVDDAAKIVGFTFSQTGIDSLAARDALIQASGGLDQFTQQADFFNQNFLTSAQQLAPIQQAVANEMARLGVAGVTTKDQFASLVQGIDTSTASGAALYSALQNVAPAFAKVADAITSLNDNSLGLEIKLLQAQGDALGATALQRQKDIDALDASLQPLQRVINATQDLSGAYNTQATTLNGTITTFTNFVTSLKQFGATLSANPGNTNILQQYALSKLAFNQTATLAEGGDKTALGNLQSVSQAFLTASQGSSATSLQYVLDLAAVKTAVAKSASAAQGQVDIAQQQLDALNQSVNGLLVLNQSVLSVKDAITALNIAQAGQVAQTSQTATAAAAQAAQAQAVAAQVATAAASPAASVPVTATAAANTNTIPGWVTPAVIAHAMQGGETTYGLREQLHNLGVPGFKTGLDRVPYDDFFMLAHKDEAVLNAPEASAWRANKNGSADSARIVDEVRALRGDMAKVLPLVERNTRKVAQILKNVNQGGDALKVESA